MNNKKKDSMNEEEKRDYINLKQYRRIESSCNRAFSPREYKVEKYTTKPNFRYHLHDYINPTQDLILNQSQFDAFIESERLKKKYEEEENRLEKFEKTMYKRISRKIKKDQIRMLNYIEKEIDEMKYRCNCQGIQQSSQWRI